MSIRDMSDSALSYYRRRIAEAYGDECKLDLLFEFVQELTELETERREKERRIDAIDPYCGEIQP